MTTDSGNKNGRVNAFPSVYRPESLTKRELFAAMAMQGIYASMSHPDILHAVSENAQGDTDKYMAESAVSAADALLAALAGDAP